DLPLARFRQAKSSSITVGLRIFTKMFEARVTITRSFCCVRSNFIEVSKHRLNRSMQAVEIEPIKSCFQPVALSFVVASQPADEIQHVGIAPHPGRKTFEAFEGVDRFRVIIFAPHKSIHAIGIGPVSFHGYRIEALTLNQTLGDLRALPVELMRSVR